MRATDEDRTPVQSSPSCFLPPESVSISLDQVTASRDRGTTRTIPCKVTRSDAVGRQGRAQREAYHKRNGHGCNGGRSGQVFFVCVIKLSLLEHRSSNIFGVIWGVSTLQLVL